MRHQQTYFTQLTASAPFWSLEMVVAGCHQCHLLDLFPLHPVHTSTSFFWPVRCDHGPDPIEREQKRCMLFPGLVPKNLLCSLSCCSPFPWTDSSKQSILGCFLLNMTDTQDKGSQGF